MRKKVLATLAGLFASAGGALAQPSAVPSIPTGPGIASPGGGFDGGDPGFGAGRGPNIIPPVLPGSGPEGGPGGEPMFGDPNGGMPGYPPPGPYGQQMYSTPRLEGAGLFGAGRTAPRVWVTAEALVFVLANQNTRQPFITTSAPADSGILNRGTTLPLFGGGDISMGYAPGFRFSGGYFRPSDQRLGVEVGGFYLSPRSNNYFGASGQDGVPVLARPFFAVDRGAQSALITSFPTFVRGSILGRTTTQFWGAEGNGLLNLYRTPSDSLRAWTVNALLGFKFVELQERLYIGSLSTVLPNNTIPFAGITVSNQTQLDIRDDFRARNMFYGAQAGLQTQYFGGRWYAGFTGKVAFGIMHEELIIDGSTTQVNFADRTTITSVGTAAGGVYANAANIGKYRDDRYAIVTDLNATIGYNVTSWFTLGVGYNVVNLSDAVRPGVQIDGRLDSTKIPTSITFGNPGLNRQPAFRLVNTDYLTHGVNFSALFRY